MFKTFLQIAAATVTVVATPAFAETEHRSFERDGVDYTYTAKTNGNIRIVDGTAYAGRVPFRLYVRANSVTGTFNGKPVDFKLPKGTAFAVADK